MPHGDWLDPEKDLGEDVLIEAHLMQEDEKLSVDLALAFEVLKVGHERQRCSFLYNKLRQQLHLVGHDTRFFG